MPTTSLIESKSPILFQPTLPSIFGILDIPNFSWKTMRRGENMIIIRRYTTLFRFISNSAIIGVKNISRMNILIIHAIDKSLRFAVSSSRKLNS